MYVFDVYKVQVAPSSNFVRDCFFFSDNVLTAKFDKMKLEKLSRAKPINGEIVEDSFANKDDSQMNGLIKGKDYFYFRQFLFS